MKSFMALALSPPYPLECNLVSTGRHVGARPNSGTPIRYLANNYPNRLSKILILLGSARVLLIQESGSWGEVSSHTHLLRSTWCGHSMMTAGWKAWLRRCLPTAMTPPLAPPCQLLPLGGPRQACWPAPQQRCTRPPSLPGGKCPCASGGGGSVGSASAFAQLLCGHAMFLQTTLDRKSSGDVYMPCFHLLTSAEDYLVKSTCHVSTY